VTSGVYQIRNLINSKCYIGSSINIEGRFVEHRRKFRLCIHENIHLQRAWNKYGGDNFGFSILITCHPFMCIYYEQQFLGQWEPEYNICRVAGSRLGMKHFIKAKQKMSTTLRERCYKHSKETRRKMSIAHIGKKHTDEHNRNFGNVVAKPYPSLTGPDGIVYPAGRNLRGFCRAHGLVRSSIYLVAVGKHQRIKGWRLTTDG